MFFPFTKIESVFALFSSYVLSKPYADWAEKYRKKSQSDTHFRTAGKICFPNAIIVADRFHVIRQAFWAMEQVRKNEQNKLSRGLRRYFKRSKYLLQKPMEALSSEEQERLALMVEIAPRLADAYRLKNEFLAVMHSESSTVGKQRLLDWLAAVNVMDLPEFHGRPRVQRLHRGLQQQNEGLQARLLRDAELPELQKSDPFLQRCTEKTAPGLSTPTRSWIKVFLFRVFQQDIRLLPPANGGPHQARSTA